jgi:hypothetical protein
MKRRETQRWIFYITFKVGSDQLFGLEKPIMLKRPRLSKQWKELERRLSENNIESIGYKLWSEYQRTGWV